MAVAESDGEYSRPDPEDIEGLRKTVSNSLQRVVRQRALELAVEVTKSSTYGGSTIQLAQKFEDYILNGAGEINGNR